MQNYLNTQFAAKSINEGLARIIVAGFIMPLDPNVSEMADVKTAVSEAVTNCVIHGYEDCEGEIEMELTYNEGLLTVKIADKGKGIENIERARMPLYTSKPENDRSGMGFTVMESFMDSLNVISSIGEGTTIIMTKRL